MWKHVVIIAFCCENEFSSEKESETYRIKLWSAVSTENAFSRIA